MAYPGTPVGQLFRRNRGLPTGNLHVMSPRLPAFAIPPGFALAQAIPQLEAFFGLVTDRIHYQSGQEKTFCREGHLRGQPSTKVSRKIIFLARRICRTPLCQLHASASLTRTPDMGSTTTGSVRDSLQIPGI